MKRTLIGVLVLVLLFLLVSYVRNLLQLAHKVKYAILFVNLDKLEFCDFHIAGQVLVVVCIVTIYLLR